MELKKICEKAFTIGSDIDLTGCHYGPHSRTKRYYEIIPYYYMLAGLARLYNMKSALDIGTHYGGSAIAISKGMGGKGNIVTVDITSHNREGIAKYPDIKRVQGDSLDLKTVARVSVLLDHDIIDMLYIDSFHTYEQVKTNIALYASLTPRLIVLDDIRINESMAKVWAELGNQYDTCDVTDICKRNCGFGVARRGND